MNTAENQPGTSEESRPGCSSDFVAPEVEMDLDVPLDRPSVEYHVSRN